MSDRSRPIPKLRPEERHTIRPIGCDREPPPELLLGIHQFNAGEYWECHETLEEIWAREPGGVRYLYQGILLVGVGMLHLQRGNHHGALTKLASGLELLTAFEPSCLGIDVSRLRREAEPTLNLLIGGSERMLEARSLPAPAIHAPG
ncbi:MAG: DUF309 domain-containing protein [Chloroflexota bacterium]|nr:DUF309 domain-containing protein [Chloroflexota bacterium]